ncbi:hypothetical protein [Nocardioides pantholopis]|uniref:hypothetical protein n=1 Tax=Nocardioides pantholopis TaxID=2483798 RepID=UPI000FD93DC6|nr:hypothetical protein [Nocardioides pantholopis]
MTQQSSGPTMPPPGAPQRTGWLRITLQGSPFTGSIITPTVRLNGQPVPASYGENLYPVVPGPWRVDVESRWLRTYGQATLDLSVREGETVPVYYAQPYHQFARGSIGFGRQRRPGTTGGVLLTVAFGLIFTLIIVLLGVLVALQLAQN